MAHKMFVYYGIKPPTHEELLASDDPYACPFFTEDEERMFAVLMEDCKTEDEVLKQLLCYAEMEIHSWKHHYERMKDLLAAYYVSRDAQLPDVAEAEWSGKPSPNKK